VLRRGQGGRAGPGRLARLAGDAGWNLADQVLSTLTNAGLTTLVAQQVDRYEFGAFSTAFLLFSLLIAVERSLVGQVLSIRHSAETRMGMRRVAARALGAILTLAVPAGLLVALAGVALGGTLRGPLVAVGLMMAPLLLQDACRNVFFAQSRPKRAALNDALWAVVQFAAMAVLITRGSATATTLILAWGGSAAVAALAAMIKLVAVPDPAATGGWVRQHRDLLGYLLPETLTATGGDKAALFLVGGMIGVDGVGAVTGARQVLNPLQIITSAAVSFVMPEVSRREHLAPRTRSLLGLGIGGGLAFSSLAYLAVILLLPDGVGGWVFGDSWSVVSPVLLPVGLFSAAAGACAGPFIVIAAMGHAKRTFRLNVLATVLLLSLMPVGALLDGAPGAAWGLCLGKVIEIPFWILTLSRVVALGPAPRTEPGAPDADVEPAPPLAAPPLATPPLAALPSPYDSAAVPPLRSPYLVGLDPQSDLGPQPWHSDTVRLSNRQWWPAE
jgi:O-antigen/teichoic acid export membrane protein